MVFVYTEIVRCGKIGTQAIRSYHTHHTYPLHIFASEDDIRYIPEHPNNIIHVIDRSSPQYAAFSQGHLGTSMLWTSVILTTSDDTYVHFDSDVYFCGDVVCDILKGLESYDIVGSFRPYKKNPNKREDVRMYPDTVQTYCFGFKREKITITDPTVLQQMVQGISWKHPVIDFFDPVTFHMLENGATIHYLDVKTIGGIDENGGRENGYPENKHFDFGSKIIHFAGVGSGANFHSMNQRGEQIAVPESYVRFGLERYDAYSRIFFGQPILNTCSIHITGIQEHIDNANLLHKSR